MREVVKLYRGQRFLGGRSLANRVRVAAEDLLARDDDTVVVLDFAGVEGVSHSFADELLSPLTELLHSAVRDRVWLVNCAPEVREDLELVATMHGLVMPALGRAKRQPA